MRNLKTTTLLLLLGCGIAALVLVASEAHAQESMPDAREQVTTKPKPRLSAEEIAKLDQCRALARTSDRLRGQVMNDLRPAIQQDDADMTMRNKKHVVMAYAALWILAVAFLILLFLRQQKLLGEIARLEREVRAAASDEEQE